MVGVTEDMASKKTLSVSLYMFRCYLLYLCKVLTIALYNAIGDIDSNFWILPDCHENQTGIFIPLVIFGIHIFPNDKDVIEFICSMASA